MLSLMWSHDLKVDKYLYTRTNPHLVRLLGFLGVSATLLMAIGYSRFFGLSPLYVLVFGPIAVIFIVNKLLRYGTQIFYPKFDIKKHEKFVSEFWSKNTEPSVDVFLPWAGEDLKMHEEVLKAVNNLDYGNYKVYMLDDNGAPAHRELAEKYGFTHLSRPNKGEHKKSGNLEYGYDRSNGEYVLILDADFIPARDSLKDLIPYIASDKKIGILQTPQYLEQNEDVHRRSKIEFGGGNIVEDFYKISLPCRDVFGAAMCVGTSAIYRREAIALLEGTPKVHASEDLATGLLITEHGYYVKYLPLIASMGKSPETFQGYFKQHHRWCSGNLVFAHYYPRAHMNVVARIIYLSNPTYYLSEAFSVIFSFHFLALLFFHTDSLSLANTLYFLPYVLFSRFLIPLSKSNKNKVGTKLAALSNSYTYIYTYIHLLIHGAPVWQPTGVKSSRIHRDFLNSTNIGIAISSTFVILFLLIILLKPHVLGDYNNYLILGWGFYSAVWHAIYLYLVSKDILPHRLLEVNSFPAKAFLYAKAHSVSALTLLLTVGLALNTIKALRSPSSLTVQAIADITGQEQPASQIQEVQLALVSPTPVPASEPVVIAAETDNNSFSYEVIIGDTPGELAQKAVSDYSLIYSVQLTQKQINNAANKLVKSSEISKLIHPGEVVTFDKNLIAKFVLEAI